MKAQACCDLFGVVFRRAPGGTAYPAAAAQEGRDAPPHGHGIVGYLHEPQTHRPALAWTLPTSLLRCPATHAHCFPALWPPLSSAPLSLASVSSPPLSSASRARAARSLSHRRRRSTGSRSARPC